MRDFLAPLLRQAPGELMPVKSDSLKNALNEGILLVTGVRLWNALHSESWRHREAAVQAFLEFINSRVIDKYSRENNSELLFVTAI